MSSKTPLVPRKLIFPFILVTTLFFAWGFANDITNPMVKAFSKIFRMSVTDGALVQLAFYGGYFVMAFPAALFIRKYSYKAGILLGLTLYGAGALLFIPASITGYYYPFLIAYFILTCGLSFLETSSNPYILSMGDESTATRRLNLAQAFNPIGSLLGMFAAMVFIQARMNPMSTAERAQLDWAIRSRRTCRSGTLSHHALYPHAKECRQRPFPAPRTCPKTHLFHPPLSRRRHCPILLRRRANHGMDLHHPIWHPHLCQSRHDGTRRRNLVPAIQHCRYGNLLCQPLYLHLPVKILLAGQTVDDPGYRRSHPDRRCHRLPGHQRALLPGRRIGLHVSDVPDHLRYCPARLG